MIKILIIVFSLFSNAVFASDEKSGRYFEDQPDVTDEPQVHFIYLLNKDSEDREWDINGKMEKELLEANEKMFEMTKPTPQISRPAANKLKLSATAARPPPAANAMRPRPMKNRSDMKRPANPAGKAKIIPGTINKPIRLPISV